MTERKQLEQAILALEAQRHILGEAVVDAALGSIRRQLEILKRVEKSSPFVQEGERKFVTVMFADITGFTPLSEELDPEAVRELVNACFDCLVPVINKYHGTVEKFIGDEILAIFGAPVVHENDPESALFASLEMMSELEVFSKSHDIEIGMHIGISTGQVIAGRIGIEGQQQYGVMGDAVNLASKLVDIAEQGDIFVGPDTFRLTEHRFDFLHLSPMHEKDETMPMQIYKLLAVKDRKYHLGLGEVNGIKTRMIGREKEMDALRGRFNNAIINRNTTLITIIGKAGIGKSRLLYEFENWLGSQPGKNITLKGRCTQQLQNAANSLIRELVAYRFGISESDPIEVVRKKLETGVTELLPDNGEMNTHFLGAWLGYDYSHSPHIRALRGDMEQLHNRALRYLGQLVGALTAKAPVVVLIENLHWADKNSLNVILKLCKQNPGLPLFILCLARPELLTEQQKWGSGLMDTHFQQMDLHPLTAPDVRALVSEIFQKVDEVPAALFDFVVSRAEGNPYYVEELVQMLIDQQVVCATSDIWQVRMDKLAEIHVPATLTAILQARLDRLPPLQKQALQQASVVGQVFWDAVLAEFGTKADTQLEELSKLQMVLPQYQSTFSGTKEYFFKHALLRDVTYGTVLIKSRRVYHQLVGNWLVKVAKANRRTDEYAAIIGAHYAAAGELTEASTWFGQAGKRAAGQFDHESAEKWLSGALDLTALDDKAARYELLIAREGVYHLKGDREKQAADLAMLAELTDGGSGDTDLILNWRSEVLIRQAAYAMAVSDYPGAINAAEAALIIARQISDGELASAALACWGEALWRQGEYKAAQKQYLEGRLQALKAGAQANLADSLKGLGTVAYEQGEYTEARKFYTEALGIYREIGDQRGESACLGNLGLVAADQGEFTEARKYHEASLEIVREIGYRRGEGIRLNNLGVVARDLGDYLQALKYHQAALDIYQDIGYLRGESICLLNLGVVAYNQGNCTDAREYYCSSLEIARKAGYRSGEGLVLHDLGALALADKNIAEAEMYFRQALTLHEELGQPQHVAEDQAGIAGVALEKREHSKARLALVPVLDYLTENPTLSGSMHPYRVVLICGEVLLASGESEMAAEIIGAAVLAWDVLERKLSTQAERERFRQIPEYATLRKLWHNLEK